MLDVTRRRFLLLCGAGISGLWLSSRGLVRLPGELVAHLTGACSFCRKSDKEVRALVGVLGRPTRICDECIGLCVDIFAEELGLEIPRMLAVQGSIRRISDDPLVPDHVEVVTTLIPDPATGLPDRDLLAQLRRLLDEVPLPAGAGGGLSQFRCSFCDAERRAVRKLVAGPRLFVCDRCILEGAGLCAGVLRT